MLAESLGRRYERLLFFTAPITLATWILAVIAVGGVMQEDRFNATCYQIGTRFIVSNRLSLLESWQLAQEAGKRAQPAAKAAYRSRLIASWSGASLKDDIPPKCYGVVSKVLHEFADLDPSKNNPESIKSELSKRAADLAKRPLEMGGIELPPSTTFNVVGNSVKIELGTLARLLQVALFPVLLIWLGSLYATRYRETFAIHRASSLEEVFPHLLNLYPIGSLQTPRKRVWYAPYFLPTLKVLYTASRVVLLLMFLGPPVLAYLASLFSVAAIRSPNLLEIGASFLVTIFTLATVVVETFPWHAWRSFPGPSLRVA
jgi:hypothetical protein